MFEAVIAVCLTVAGGPCRDQLLPGYEAATEALCLAALAARPPVVNAGLEADGAPFCQPVGEVLDFEEVAEGVFVHMGLIEEPNRANRGDVSNIGFVVGGQGVAVIDTGTAPWMGEGVWRAIRARTDKPVSHVILTHMHPDHVLGASALVRGGAMVVGHAALPRALADRRDNYLESLERLIGAQVMLGAGAVPVDVTVEDKAEVDLGGRVLELRAWPVAHTGADLTVLDQETGTLFAGDLVFHRHLPALDGRLLGWQAVLREMSGLEIARVVPGHGGPVLDWPAGGADQQRYLDVLEADTRAAIDAGQRLGEAVEGIAQSEAPLWELFEAYNPRNATVAFTELEWE
ncbi:MAG: quinoprotein relay system zinc metallohydrolase 2 [Ruegeria sp.]